MLCRHYTKGASHSQWPKVLCVISSLQLSSSFLTILAVPNEAAFCNSPVLISNTSLLRPCIQPFVYYSECANDHRYYFQMPNPPKSSNFSLQVLIILNLFSFLSMGVGRSYIHYDCLVIFLSTTTMSGLDNMVTLDGHIPQDLTFFVFHYPFRLMFIPFLTSAHTYNGLSSGPIWQYCSVFSRTRSVPTSYTH